MSYWTITTSEDRYTVQRHSTPPRGWNPAGECGKLSKVIGKSNVQPEGLQLSEDQRIQSIITTMESIREPLVEASSQNRQIAVIKDLGEQIKSINKLISKACEAKEKIENKQKKVVKKEKEREEKASLKMQAQKNKLQTKSEKKERKIEEKRVKEKEKEAGAKEKVVEKERKRHPVILGASKQQPVSKTEAFPFEFVLTSDEIVHALQLPGLLGDDDGGIGQVFSVLHNKNGALTKRGQVLAQLLARYTGKPPERIEEILKNMGNAWVELAPQVQGYSKSYRPDCVLDGAAFSLLDAIGSGFIAIPAMIYFLQNVNVSEFMQAKPESLVRALFDADYSPQSQLEKLFKEGFTPLIREINGIWEGKDIVAIAKSNYAGNKEWLQKRQKHKLLVRGIMAAPIKKVAARIAIDRYLNGLAKKGLLQSAFLATQFQGEAVAKFEENLLLLEKLMVKAVLKKHNVSHYLPLIMQWIDNDMNILTKLTQIAEARDEVEVETLKKEFLQTFQDMQKSVTLELIKVVQIVLEEISTNPEEPEVFKLLMDVLKEFRWHPQSRDFSMQLYEGVIVRSLDRLSAPEKPKSIEAPAPSDWVRVSKSTSKEKESENKT